RKKESAHDYRYFPEPDLPKLYISEIKEFSLDVLKKILPELPWGRRERLSKYDLKKEDIELYVSDREVGNFFELVLGKIGADKTDEIKLLSNYTSSDLMGLSKNSNEGFSSGKLEPQNFAKIILMTKAGTLSSRGAKDILKIIFDNG